MPNYTYEIKTPFPTGGGFDAEDDAEAEGYAKEAYAQDLERYGAEVELTVVRVPESDAANGKP